MGLRAATIGLILLVATFGGAAAHHPSAPPIHRFHPGEGWYIDAFSAPGDFDVAIGESGMGENFVELVLLYDLHWNFIGGTSFAWRGGDQVQVSIVQPGAPHVEQNANGPVADVRSNGGATFLCATMCGPSHSYKLLVIVGGDDVTSFGYGVLGSGITRHWNMSGDGTNVHAFSSSSMGGSRVHASAHNARGAPTGGISIVTGAAQEAHVEKSLVSYFRKEGGSSGTLAINGPITRDCSGPAGCLVAAGVPGDYVFEHAQTDLNGAEAFLLWADIPKV